MQFMDGLAFHTGFPVPALFGGQFGGMGKGSVPVHQRFQPVPIALCLIEITLVNQQFRFGVQAVLQGQSAAVGGDGCFDGFLRI